MGSAPSSNTITSSNVSSRSISPNHALELNGIVTSSSTEATAYKLHDLLERNPYRIQDMLRVQAILSDATPAEKLDLLKLGVFHQILGKIHECSNIDIEVDIRSANFPSQNSVDSVESPVAKTTGFNEFFQKPSNNVFSAGGILMKSEGKKGNMMIYSTNMEFKRVKTASNKNGVGYGTGSTRSRWNIRQTVEDRIAQLEHMMWLLSSLSAFLWGETMKEQVERWNNFQDEEKLRFVSNNFELPDHLNYETTTTLIVNSVLLPLLSHHLNNDSVFDVSQHVDFFQAVFELTTGMIMIPSLLPFMVPQKGENNKSIAKELVPRFCDTLQAYPLLMQGRASPDLTFMEFINKVNGLAEVIVDVARKYELQLPSTEKRINNTAFTHRPACINRSAGLPGSFQNKNFGKENRRSSMALPIENCQKEATKTESVPSNCIDNGRTAMQHISSLFYTDLLKNLQMNTYKLLDDELKPIYGFAYKKELRSINPFSISHKERTKRIAKELASLHNALPLNESNSIFICMDESRCDVLKVLISGPDDTPYQNGLFEFDIFFPSSYPNQPPKCSFLTTGDSSVRFNPNLYNDGKICLSILPNLTIFRVHGKVLVSIQGLIFVKKPYFNEPGYEKAQGTPKGEEVSRRYNLHIENATLVYAILNQFRNPPPYFSENIKRHFWCKREAVIRQAARWLHEMASDIKNNPPFDQDNNMIEGVFLNPMVQRQNVRKLIEEFSCMKNPLKEE